ncbi:ECF-type sigma factor [Sphingomonas immobilis]|uniref:ECF-type sigma factor n=1 Tax=Sphingomonas immobilis TaxID=3063997 RepID=A0ABT8ZW93_9SPHN|nr:ECF-type sigma factor [Sphingomonas sp. CA1-15]MDO7841846.1 ECF-type sigma factor [Sphingomonas sp. CA1-15]
MRFDDRTAASRADGVTETRFDLDTDALVVTLYSELRKIARREHLRAGAPQTLQTTALIGEVYLKLKRHEVWQSRPHFLACASTAIRHLLVDAARARSTAKRSAPQMEYDDRVADERSDRDLVKLGDALESLARIDSELARLVDCRFFAGYDERETAEILGISDRTVRRRWVQAKAWIHNEIAA